jgi:phenylpropionate dioxygenase-like ring-hydroxylating dioxygenase large terminal subunit
MTIDFTKLTEAEASGMDQFEKPAEGTWTESFGLDFAPVSARDNYDPEFYELEKEAVFKRSWLHVGRETNLPRKGTYFTRELEGLGYSLIVVRGMDDKVRAFHNVCSHRGNQVVWDENPTWEAKGNCREFTCKYHGWRYSLEGEINYVHNAPEYRGLDAEKLHLPEVHCEVWCGFVFVNFDKTPRQSLREYLGDELVKLEQYPFHLFTETHRLEAVVNSNWKMFMDAFSEFYHVPFVHAKLNNPDDPPGGDKIPFVIPYFSRYGKHRHSSSGGQFANLKGRGMLPSQEVFKATIHGALNPPDIGPISEINNPGHLEGWGNDMFHIFPNFTIMTWSRNTVVTYDYWPLGPDKHQFVFDYHFVPPKSATERLTQEMIVAVSKDFALQDANVLEATHRRYKSEARTEFQFCDQEVNLRHLHAMVREEVDAYKQELAAKEL